MTRPRPDLTPAPTQTMLIEDAINAELARLDLLPLNVEQVECLNDPARITEAAAMLTDLRDRCMVRLPASQGADLSGPYADPDAARAEAQRHLSDFPVVTVDEMATDASRSLPGIGNEFYVQGHTGAAAALALAEENNFVTMWVAGQERAGA